MIAFYISLNPWFHTYLFYSFLGHLGLVCFSSIDVIFFLNSCTANRHFLRTMARVGAGSEEFFDPKTKSKWERKAKLQLSKAFQPALTSVTVEWQQHDDNAPKPMQVR